MLYKRQRVLFGDIGNGLVPFAEGCEDGGYVAVRGKLGAGAFLELLRLAGQDGGVPSRQVEQFLQFLQLPIFSPSEYVLQVAIQLLVLLLESRRQVRLSRGLLC